jgi:hypothetical protein
MHCKIVELTNQFNWGKFMLGRFDEDEWYRPAHVDGSPFSLFKLGGHAPSDLEKHRIWVCPMFEPFLKWFYFHKEFWADLDAIPEIITLTDDETMAASALAGYRRPGRSGPSLE